jgi:rsbT co-antagonist protein RsbR
MKDTMPSIAPSELTIALFRRMLESAPLVLWAVDRDGNYTVSEGGGLDALGMRSQEAVGLSALEMFKDNPEVANALVRALAGEETRARTSPARGLHFESWYAPLRGPDGEVCGATCLSLDVSDRVRDERELRDKVELIERQSATIRALATPIIQVWDGVLCLPVIGTVDSARTAEMMQGLLESIVKEQARYAIVDLTGVEIVDTSTADHLIQLFRAARVLGVEGVLCGIRPAVAQTIVGLGLDLGTVKTMRSLRDALKWCIRARALQGAASPDSGSPRGAR